MSFKSINLGKINNLNLIDIKYIPEVFHYFILVIIWFPTIFSNFLPGTEIFPWGIVLLFFLKIKNLVLLHSFLIFSLLFTFFKNQNQEIYDFFRSFGPFINIFAIFYYFKQINYKKYEVVIKKSILTVIYINCALLFLEILNLDNFTYYFLPDRGNEISSYILNYNNRFNFLETEPSRLSINLFSISILSKLIFKNNRFLILLFIIDMIFVRSLIGYFLWFLIFFLLKKKETIYFFLLFSFINFIFIIDPRINTLLNLFFDFSFIIFEKIIYFSGHRLPGIIMSINLIFENPLGYGFIDTSEELKNYLNNNLKDYKKFLEPTQMIPMFLTGKASLVGFFSNILFTFGIFSLPIIYFILKEIFANFKRLNPFFKKVIIVFLISSIFLFDKGIAYNWILFGYLNNKSLL